MMSEDYSKELAVDHAGQRYGLLLVMLVGVAAIVVLSVCLIAWIEPTSAQIQVTGTPEPVQEGSKSDLTGRVEELSRSQDRLVTALIGAVGVIGTVLVIIVGLSTFQANRNAERETELIRGIAMNHITEAASTAQGQVDAIVADAKQDLEKTNTEAVANSRRVVADKLSNATRRMKQISVGEIDRLRGTVESVRKESSDFAAAAANYFIWMALAQVDAAAELNGGEDAKNHGLALINLSLAGSGISQLQERQERGLLTATNLRLLHRGLDLLNADFDIPEQNNFWYENNNKNLNSIQDLRNKLSLDFAQVPGDTNYYQRQIDELLKFLPSKPDRLSPDQLERLVNTERAKKSTNLEQ